MSYIKIRIPETKEDWLKQRALGLGGSDAGSVLGVNRYKSAYQLFCEKTGLIPDRVEDNEAMRTGRDLEDYVARRFCEATGKKVRKSGFSYKSIQYPFMLANVDRWVCCENAILECKTASIFYEKDYESGYVPDSYKAQCLHYMAVTGADRCYLAVFIPGRSFYWYVFEREEVQEEIDFLIESEKAFWKMVQEKKFSQPLDGSASTSQTLDALYPADQVESDSFFMDLESLSYELEEYQSISNQIKELKDRQDIIKNAVKSMLGNAVTGEAHNAKVTWSTRKSVSVDKKKLQKEYPEAYESCIKETVSRMLKITGKEIL